ncbi:MAG: energy transducer TonB [Vitreimonas sp.]
MWLWGALAGCVLAGAVGVASAQDDIDARNHGVIWIERPTASEFDRFYPPEAREQEVVGRVVLLCTVNLDTRASCAVQSELPLGWSFGRAALSISESFRLQPMVRNGRALATGQVRVPISFRLGPHDDTWRESLAPDVRAFVQNFPTPDLPAWDRAPNIDAVNAAYPPAALAVHARGRGVLSCTINTDRTLACAQSREAPVANGFGAAALSLAPAFRVDEGEADFISAHRTTPFLLPVNFGAAPLQEPLNTEFNGIGPITLPPAPSDIIRFAYPPEALARRIGGDAVIICTLRDGGSDCGIESQSPAEWHFGESALALITRAAPTAEQLALLPGDQIRFPFHFAPS